MNLVKTMSVSLALGRYREEVERELKSLIMGHGSTGSPRAQNLFLYRMMAYQMGWTDERGQEVDAEMGERIHATVCLLTCEALGGEREKALPAAAALELAHNFSLIHEDIQDGIQARGGIPSVWRIWGIAQAINAGDGMHALARLSLLRQMERERPAAVTLRAVDVLDTACLRLCEGEYMELDSREWEGITPERYFRTVGETACALMGCAGELGALMASAGEETMRSMARFGQKLGLASRIRDDILAIWGPEKGDFPSRGGVLSDKRRSLPLIYSFEKARGAERRSLDDAYSKRTMEPRDVAEVLEVLDRLDARGGCQRKADALCQEALEALEEAGLSATGRDELGELAHFAVNRDSYSSVRLYAKANHTGH